MNDAQLLLRQSAIDNYNREAKYEKYYEALRDNDNTTLAEAKEKIVYGRGYDDEDIPTMVSYFYDLKKQVEEIKGKKNTRTNINTSQTLTSAEEQPEQPKTEEEKLKDEIYQTVFDKITEEFKDKVQEEDDKEYVDILFSNIKDWLKKNLDRENLSTSAIKTQMFKDLGFEAMAELVEYVQKTYDEDSDMYKGLVKATELLSSKSLDDVVESIVPVIKSDLPYNIISRVPDYLFEAFVKDTLREIRKKNTSVSTEVKNTEDKDNVIDADYEEVEGITFDDSGLVEVKITTANEDGATVWVKPTSVDSLELIVDYTDLINEDGRYFISQEVFAEKNNFREEVTKIVENTVLEQEEVKLMMKGLSENVKVKVEPTTDPNSYDRIILTTEDKLVLVMLDLEGTYVSKHKKVLVMFRPNDKLVALPVKEGLFNDILTKDKAEFDKNNILSDEVMELSDKLNLSDIPVASFNTVLNNIFRTKALKEVILNSKGICYFEGKITSKNFTISNGEYLYHYNNGKVTNSIIK